MAGAALMAEAPLGAGAPKAAAVVATVVAAGVVRVTMGEPGQTGQGTVVTMKPDGTWVGAKVSPASQDSVMVYVAIWVPVGQSSS